MIDFTPMQDKQDTPKVGVGVFVIRKTPIRYTFWNEFLAHLGRQPLPTHKVEILLGKRKGSHGANEWSLPGGHLDLGENLMGCCFREVQEETGIEIKHPDQVCFTNNIFEREGLHYVTLYFQADCEPDDEPQLKEPDKCHGWEWFEPHCLPNHLWGHIRFGLKRIKT